MSVAIRRKGMIETELRRAIQHGELRIHYQAKVDVRTTRVVGAEALLRWMHPTLGLTGPMEFIPIAEESGMIVAVTRFVIKEVCRQIVEWRDEGRRTIPVSINLDALSLQKEDLASYVVEVLRANALDASTIEFEVTESSLMRDMGRARLTLERLRAIGIKLSIDDFGTGYSSLTYLKRFPVDVLKIDRSFIKDLTTADSDAALATAVIAMGHSLKLELVAEGVETWEQAEFLAERRCFLIQGYLFARPLPPANFAELVRSGLQVEGKCSRLGDLADAALRADRRVDLDSPKLLDARPT